MRIKKFLAEHPNLTKALGWVLPVTVGGVTTYLIYYYGNNAMVEAKSPDLDKCSYQSLESDENSMNNCTNFVSGLVCGIRNCTYYPTINFCSDNGGITICGMQMPFSSLQAQNYNCTVNGENIALKCFDTGEIKKEILDKITNAIFFGSAIAGGIVGKLAKVVQDNLPSCLVSGPTFCRANSDREKLSSLVVDYDSI